MKHQPPQVSDVIAAKRILSDRATTTPLLEATLLNNRTAMRLLVKAECLQKTGSFKFRGAYNKLARRLEQCRSAGVVAYSGGNHAQGVAAAASLLGVDALVLMPADAPQVKIERTRALGSAVQFYDRWLDDRDAIAEEIIQRTGRVLVPSFDDPDIIAGQGTVGLEIVEQCRAMNVTPDVVLIPCGGGGLCAGASLVLKQAWPNALVYGVEPEAFDDTRRSLISGQRERNSSEARSLCDALLTQCGDLTLGMNLKTLDGALAVSDEQALQAMKALFMDLKIVTEPGGAVAVAAALSWQTSNQIDLAGKTVVAIASGGNVEAEVFRAALDSKWEAAS